MSTVRLEGETLWVQDRLIEGIRLLGFTAGRTEAILSIDHNVSSLLASTEYPLSLLFSALANTLHPLTPPPSQPADEPKRQQVQLPRKLRPYLRYTDEQMRNAWAKTTLTCSRHYRTKGYVRLYLTRTSLIEMYEYPRHLKLVYANMLKGVDAHEDRGGTFPLAPLGPSDPVELHDTDRLKPYQHFEEAQMKAALHELGIARNDVKRAYAYLGLTLRRDALLQFCLKPPHLKPAIAYLLRLYDQMKAED